MIDNINGVIPIESPPFMVWQESIKLLRANVIGTNSLDHLIMNVLLAHIIDGVRDKNTLAQIIVFFAGTLTVVLFFHGQCCLLFAIGELVLPHSLS
jgi:hypothetical protein